ncbi:bifunctional DNA-formamidopyrimidine glycosylase/DNA-(apurinic or apyrimidinic site) lyase [Micrococcus lylae]|uniref:bifunctional DNA-formamidopyrimidine glycosylase/DNA-(apurinic or apyrimidinic site) lyase n=1 Tax=Micrococcus lylae TaxID=1273 RepID=UPI0021A2F5FE|nr:bifunctional DNA-formamidopyrimidine glycosylase/DNA-(apurinic or apyrimidinic site) lyase [Micrococcus lylae]MCT2006666.1 bifunctional DNA-formamidopyrimidine glycosylase/DNA-(apurinic or apyrimidinic site) lyase [Micrococcus lylae]MCT2070905.1 bifunctional DNA-formamidopyrimidine glycosylase/DNA-(apurinic or apyrimidinic site) lyase [Micrococcus lylae]
MPELPEVEVVRRGLLPFTAGAHAGRLEVLDPRSLRRSPGGEESLRAALDGRLLGAPMRRGKFLWIPLAEAGEAAVVVHLGMSGQVRVDDATRPDPPHLRLRLPVIAADGREAELRFVDQRIFGGWWLDRLVTDPATGERIPTTAAHIALDPLHRQFDPDAVHDRWRRSRTRLKRALLDQSLVSGIGNVYADEALWASRLHPERRTATLSRAQGHAVLTAAATVMERALAVGGTSFDALYVNVDGRSGYFARSLNAYGRTGEPCPRCRDEGRDGVIVREAFMGRSSHRCRRCQPRPRT